MILGRLSSGVIFFVGIGIFTFNDPPKWAIGLLWAIVGMILMKTPEQRPDAPTDEEPK